jgi:hypothetical protein
MAERQATADDTVRRIANKPGDPWRLDEGLPLPGPAVNQGSPENWSKRPD